MRPDDRLSPIFRDTAPALLTRMLIVGLALSAAGCDLFFPPQPPDPGGDMNTNGDQNSNGNPGGNPGGDPGGNPGDMNPPQMPAIPNTANSITSAAGAGRSDPEGVAPAVASTTLLSWKDSRGANRTMTLGSYLYHYDYSFDDNVQIVSRSANDDAYGHAGFGFPVSHNSQNGNSPLGKANVPTKIETQIFAGGHHAIYRIEMLYDRDKEGGGMGIKIPMVIEWMVATGRDHPIWATTWKVGDAINPGNVNFNAYRMDVRAPYGSLNFDGAANKGAGDAIGGVSWGDFGLLFTTTAAQLTMNSPWTYNSANSVCFTRAWTANVNAEMGIVQTRTQDKEMGYGDRVIGRERTKTSADAFTNKGDCNAFSDARAYTMPCVNGWPYQLMNYDWDPGTGKPLNEATGTKLIAWGTPYGWLGASSFDLFDFSGTANGSGDRAYATFIVLGPKNRFNAMSGLYDADGDVVTVIKGVEALAAATIGAVGPGTLTTQLPRGPGASQLKTLSNGFNDTYAAHYVNADGNKASFTFMPGAGKSVRKPIFVIRNYTATQLPAITTDGGAISVNSGQADSGAFVSLNDAGDELWITLNRTVTAATAIAVTAP